jgi:hypothetical protein
MSNLLNVINTAREETITKHYDAAFCELKDKVISEPLKTKFQIYSGCVSKDVASEIAFRFIEKGIKSTVSYTLFQRIYLEVEVVLPDQLEHKKEDVEVKEEVKEGPKEEVATTEN